MKEKMYHYTSESEKSSWENSLKYISEVISSSNLPDDCTIILEYNLPISSSSKSSKTFINLFLNDG